ncbi:ATP-binding cassette domain-containing protein [Escherichia coli]|nr:ATP-binding cassette domain-containing protein [Escherichia coli]
MNSTPVLEMRNIAKAFGKFYALKGVDLTVYPGEIHALMGENGAGKSTLMKVLAGAYTATSGEILIDGKPFHIRTPKDALSAGITLIYQEMQLAPNLSVAENIFLGSELSHGGLVQRKEMLVQAQKVIDRLGAQFNASDKVMTLTIAEQQQVEIARALHRNSRILVMDEPTAALSSRETHRLFELIMRLRDEGMAIIYISHRMAEVYELSDRVSVLRDGQYVGSLTRDNLNAGELVRMMVGRPLSDLFNKERDIPLGKARLNVHHLTDGGKVQPSSLLVRSGEIVGLAGLVGAGRSELAQLIFGVRKATGGMIEVDGEPVVIHSPREAIDLGIGFLTENRKEQGLFLEMAAAENITMATLERDARWGMLNRKKAQTISDDAIKLLNIRVPHAQVRAGGLSGGNQQKLLISRWVAIGPRILLLDEPARGVDVGAKSEIYRIMNEMARKGVAILMISSELPEIVGMSDLMQTVGILPILILIVAVFGFITPNFFTESNLLNITRQASINIVLAAGMTFIILTGGIDLSVGSILGTTAVAAMVVSLSPEFAMLSIPAALMLGLLLGLFNGALVAFAGLPPFIVTLGTYTALRGAAYLLADGTTVINSNINFEWIGNNYLGPVPWLVVIALAVIVVCWFILRRTTLGVHIYAVGGNMQAARLTGIKVWLVLLFVYGMSGLLSGLGGIMSASRLYSANGNLGMGYELDAIAAVILGGTSFVGGIGTITGTLVGALIIATLNNGMTLMGVSYFWQLVIKGAMIIIAVLIDKYRTRHHQSA